MKGMICCGILVLLQATISLAQQLVIKGQRELRTDEGKPITIGLDDITVEADQRLDYPNGFYLEIDEDDNYDVNGSTITPAARFAGNLKVKIRLTNGAVKSNKFQLRIRVAKVSGGDEDEDDDDGDNDNDDDDGDNDNDDDDGDNDDGGDDDDNNNGGGGGNDKNRKPSIISQVAVEINKNQSFAIRLSHLVVNDPDNDYPEDFSLKVEGGNGYNVSGTTVTPDQNFVGVLTVKVRVNDGKKDSNIFDFQITVNDVAPSNSKPVITAQTPLLIFRNETITLELKHLSVTDPDNSYPADFTLIVLAGANYTVSGHTVRPSAGFVGTLTVNVRVNDGKIDSDVFNFQITVNDVAPPSNVKPVIIATVPLSIFKDTPVTLKLSHLSVMDPDNDYPADFTLTVLTGSNYAVSGHTITPSAGFVGTLAVKVQVNDGRVDSDGFNFQITVNDVVLPNAKPVITAQGPLSTFKNESITLKLAHLSVADADGNYPSGFTLTVIGGTNYTVSGHTITPSAGFVGSLIVKVKVNDGKDDSNVFDVKVNVLERGTLQILSQNRISILEDSAYTFRLSDLNVSDPSDSYPAGFRLSIIEGSNYTIEGLTVRPGLNFYGNLIVRLKVAKGTASSNVFEALVIVRPVNDPPAFAAFDTAPIAIKPFADVAIAKEIATSDVDSDRLAFAEAELDSANMLTYLNNTRNDNIRGIFDQKNGVLVLLGDASLDEYDSVLRSITYTTTDSISKKQTIRFRLNDGDAYSKWYEKTLIMSDTELTLDIPTAFTPNNDNANDTWVITLRQNDSQAKFDLKIYNRQGALLFESDSIERHWDGKFNGELLPADSYFFTLEVKTEYRHSRRKGIVAILR